MASLRFILVFSLSIELISASRILVIVPSPSLSHSLVFRSLTSELLKKHEVVVWTANPQFEKDKAPKNIIELDFHNVSYALKSRSEIRHQMNTVSPKKFMPLLLKYMMQSFERQANSKIGQDFLKTSQNFDLIISEAWSPMALTLTHIFKAPIIQMSSFAGVYENYYYMAAPTHPVLYPQYCRQIIYNLSFLEKIQEVIEDFSIKSYRANSETFEKQITKELFGSDFPAISKLEENVDFLALNSNPVWDGYRPVPPSIAYMGGIHQNQEKPLPQELKTYLDTSASGVIYMSFGSNVIPSTLSPSLIQMFMDVFSRLPYDVLFKYDGDKLPGKPNNVRIQKWFPQADLLRHPRVKVFITQAGLQSTDEAITGGVPLIACPMLADQWFNAEKYEHFGIGIKIDLASLTEQVLEKALKTVLNDKRYQDNISRLGIYMRDQPQSPLERAVWWTEYVLRHRGAKHLKPTRASWIEYLLLDVLFTLIALLFSLIYLIVFVWRKKFTLQELGVYEKNNNCRA